MILKELCKQDSNWREIAFRICKDRMLADDLVQNMYLKLKDVKKYNEYFITIVIKNLFLDIVKKQKDIRIEDLYYLQDHTKKFEPDDEQQKILDAFENTWWVQKELLLERSVGKTLRQIGDENKMNYVWVLRRTTEAKEEIIKKANNG